MKISYRNVAQILCYHDTMQILCYYGNIINIFQRKYLKLQCKKTTYKKKDMIRLHTDSLRNFLNFLSSFSEFRA